MKRTLARALVTITLLGAAAMACRQTDPTLEPRMPANSPLPKIDRPDDSPPDKTPSSPTKSPSDGGSR